MTNTSDLRDRAARVRDQLPPRRQAVPPVENGRRIGTIDRSDTEQIRVNWSEFEGKPYVSLRLWKKDDQGQWWPDGKRGMSVRIRELPDLVDALAEALDLAEAEQRRWHDQQASRPRPPMPGRRPMEPVTSGDGEFNEFQ